MRLPKLSPAGLGKATRRAAQAVQSAAQQGSSLLKSASTIGNSPRPSQPATAQQSDPKPGHSGSSTSSASAPSDSSATASSGTLATESSEVGSSKAGSSTTRSSGSAKSGSSASSQQSTTPDDGAADETRRASNNGERQGRGEVRRRDSRNDDHAGVETHFFASRTSTPVSARRRTSESQSSTRESDTPSFRHVGRAPAGARRLADARTTPSGTSGITGAGSVGKKNVGRNRAVGSSLTRSHRQSEVGSAPRLSLRRPKPQVSGATARPLSSVEKRDTQPGGSSDKKSAQAIRTKQAGSAPVKGKADKAQRKTDATRDKAHAAQAHTADEDARASQKDATAPQERAEDSGSEKVSEGDAPEISRKSPAPPRPSKADYVSVEVPRATGISRFTQGTARPQRIEPRSDRKSGKGQSGKGRGKKSSRAGGSTTPSSVHQTETPAARTQTMAAPQQAATTRVKGEGRPTASQPSPAGGKTSTAGKTSTKVAPTGIRHVPGIDGLRGLAVISVVIYHLFGNVLPGGYLGVDVFFVLSGFLITSLLLREFVYSRTISLKNFWIRRVRRIAPAAISTLVICAAIAGVIGGDVNVNLDRQFWSSALFVNNWVQIAHSQSYFAQSELPIFAHYWSLSVEEQFYIIWPLIVSLLLVILRKTPRLIGKLALLGAVVSALAMAIIVDPGHDATRVYYGTDTHAFGLLIGAALASITISSSTEKRGDTWGYREGLLQHGRILSLLAIPALAVQIFYFFWLGDQDTFTYRGGLISSSLIVAIIIASVVRNNGPVAAIFRNKVLRHLGFISFSLYLWHVPANLFVVSLFQDYEWGRKKWITGLIAIVISLVAAELSFRFIETPIRRYGFIESTRKLSYAIFGERSTNQQRFGGAMVPAAMILCCVFTGLAIHNTNHGTALESELERLQAENRSERGAVKPAPKVVTHDVPKDGTNINAIGDSVMLASQAELQKRFPGIDINAEVSRHYQAAPAIIADLKAQDALRQFVFLGFGTNGQAFPGQLDEIIKAIGPKHTIVIAMPYGDRWYMQNAQQQVVDAAKKYPNVYAADWCAYADDHVSELASDEIHPRGNATVGYTNAFVAALKQWASGKKDVPPICPPAA